MFSYASGSRKFISQLDFFRSLIAIFYETRLIKEFPKNFLNIVFISFWATSNIPSRHEFCREIRLDVEAFFLVHAEVVVKSSQVHLFEIEIPRTHWGYGFVPLDL